MGLFKWLIGYQAAKHLLKTTRPQPVSVHLHIELPEDGGDCEDAGSLSCPGDGIYVRDDGVNPPRFFNRDGAETDERGFLL